MKKEIGKIYTLAKGTSLDNKENDTTFQYRKCKVLAIDSTWIKGTTLYGVVLFNSITKDFTDFNPDVQELPSLYWFYENELTDIK